MTEGPRARHEVPMCVRICLEVGHACEPRVSALGRALALDWRVWVRGPGGADISHIVHKVVFHLRPASAFVYPKRVIQEPPYEIIESGCASIEIPIHVYLKYSNKPKRISLRYGLQIANNLESRSEARCVYYDVENPSEPLWRALLQCGGQAVPRAAQRQRLASYAPLTPLAPLMPAKRYKYVEPLDTPRRHAKKYTKEFLVEEACPKCGDIATVDIKKHLSPTKLNESEIEQVSQLYKKLSSYEKKENGLKLPQLSDPIFKLPEFPDMRWYSGKSDDSMQTDTGFTVSSDISMP